MPGGTHNFVAPRTSLIVRSQSLVFLIRDGWHPPGAMPPNRATRSTTRNENRLCSPCRTPSKRASTPGATGAGADQLDEMVEANGIATMPSTIYSAAWTLALLGLTLAVPLLLALLHRSPNEGGDDEKANAKKTVSRPHRGRHEASASPTTIAAPNAALKAGGCKAACKAGSGSCCVEAEGVAKEATPLAVSEQATAAPPSPPLEPATEDSSDAMRCSDGEWVTVTSAACSKRGAKARPRPVEPSAKLEACPSKSTAGTAKSFAEPAEPTTEPTTETATETAKSVTAPAAKTAAPASPRLNPDAKPVYPGSPGLNPAAKPVYPGSPGLSPAAKPVHPASWPASPHTKGLWVQRQPSPGLLSLSRASSTSLGLLPALDKRVDAPQSRSVTLRIGGMMCGGCRKRAVDALEALEIVKAVTVSLSPPTAVVEGDPDTMSLGKVSKQPAKRCESYLRCRCCSCAPGCRRMGCAESQGAGSNLPPPPPPSARALAAGARA